MRRLLKLSAVVSVLLFSASACDLGPQYQRPVLESPGQWREAAAVSAWPSQQWWKAFAAPELDSFIAQAEAANDDLAAAVARIEEADAQARIAGAALLPSLEANPQEESVKQNAGRAVNYTAHQLSLQASYELDFWGKNRAAFSAAKQSAIAAQFDREVVNLTVLSSVASEYFQVIALRARLDVAQQNLTNARRVLDGLELEFRTGTATRLDVAQQQTIVENVSATIPPLQQQVSQSLDALAILLGRPPEAIMVAPHPLDAIAVPSVSAGLPSELLARRPDVREAEAQLIAANFDIKNARAQLYPDFSLTAEGGVQSVALDKLFTPEGLMYDLVASAVQPIFEGGKLVAQVDFSKARYAEQLADYRKAVISAFSDVEDGLAATRRTRETAAAALAAAEQARQAFAMADTQFRAGTVNLLTLLSTETTLFAAEDSYVQARLAELQAVVGLYKALGGGWSDTSGPPLPQNDEARRPVEAAMPASGLQ